jgi:hypothetical protein
LSFLPPEPMPGESTPTAPNGQPGAAPVAGDPDDPVRVALQRTNRHPIKLARLFVNAQREQAATVADLSAKLQAAEAQVAAYVALGTPETLRAAIERVPQLEQQIAQREAATQRDAVAEQVAAALGWNAKATRTFLADKGMTPELRETEVDDGRGGKVKQLVPVLAREGADPEPLATVVAREHDVYLPALLAPVTPAAPSAPPRPAAPAYPAAPLQTANGGSGPQGADVLAAKARDLGAFV